MKNLKKIGADRKWIGLIILILIAEILWLSADLQWINLPMFLKNSSHSGSKEAGHVVNSKNELKRRGVNSLIWEPAKENEILYYYDSVLTLSQSTAKLYLKDQTELQLSENTLVTLEEADDKSKSEIRLRFSKGDFKARNPSVKTSIQGDDWIVNLQKGSEVNVRKDKDTFEFEVLTGQATLQTTAGTESLDDSSIVKFGNDQQVMKIEKSQNLQWQDQKPQRIYVFEDSARVSLAWSGEASGVIINKIGDAEIVQPVLSGQNSIDVELKLGSYNVRLADDKSLSKARVIEVWKAPRIFLKKPLPRDRLKTGETYEFVWTAETAVKEYRIILTGPDGLRTESTEQNFKSLRFEKEQDVDWKIEARDDEGFLIPSLYQNRIYLRQEPLQAPKLKAPSIREPNKSSSFFWWRLLIAEARAENSARLQEILFEWEPVEGADYYSVEISSDPGFRKPEVIEISRTTHFIWKKFDAKKKFYWRVAAGNSSGRLGLFSEPEEVKPQFVKKIPAPRESTTEKPKAEVKAQETAQEVIPQPAKEEVKTPVAEKVIIWRPSGWGIAWAPAYKSAKLAGDANSEINLMGGVPLGLQLEYRTQSTDDSHFYHMKLWGASQQWKASPVSDYPFQEDLNITESWLTVSRNNSLSGSSLGLTLHQSFIPARKTEESISFRSVAVLGVRYAVGNYGISAGTSGEVHELNLDMNYKKHFTESSPYYYGAAANLLYQNNKSGSGFQGNLIFLLGLEQF